MIVSDITGTLFVNDQNISMLFAFEKIGDRKSLSFFSNLYNTTIFFTCSFIKLALIKDGIVIELKPLFELSVRVVLVVSWRTFKCKLVRFFPDLVSPLPLFRQIFLSVIVKVT
jgi:hypothetical protein